MSPKIRDVDRYEFARDDIEKVSSSMDTLTIAAEGWINLLPGVADDEEQLSRPPTPLASLFGGNKPSVTMCTWVPPIADRHGNVTAKLGVSHFYGGRVAARLQSLSLGVPSNWRIEQDHPRRGLVVRVPPDESNATVLRWAIGAGEALNGIRLTGMWRAQVYLPYVHS